MSNIYVHCYGCKKEIKEKDAIFDEIYEVYYCHKCVVIMNNAQKDIRRWVFDKKKWS